MLVKSQSSQRMESQKVEVFWNTNGPKEFFSTKSKMTPQNWGQKCQHIESFQKGAVAEPSPPIRKYDKSHDSAG